MWAVGPPWAWTVVGICVFASVDVPDAFVVVVAAAAAVDDNYYY